MTISISVIGRLLTQGACVRAGKAAEALRWFAGALIAAMLLHTPLTFAQTLTITTTHLHNDAFGNVIMATDEQGNVLWRERYQPYGAKRINQASQTNPVNLANPQDRGANSIGFHGKEADSATGLSYFGARYYDPVAGRFMGTDAVRFDPANPHSFNRYAYGNGNPYKYKDPDGNFPILLLPALVWGGQALSVLGVGITAFETTTVVRNVAVGDMTAGAAVRQELPGIAAGVALGAGGKVIGKAASHVMEAAHAKSLKDWQAVSGEQKTSIKEFFGKSHKGLDKLEKDFKLPDGLTKDTLQKYEGVATRQIQRGNDNNGLQARRLENIQKALE